VQDLPLQFNADARARLHQLYRELTENGPTGRLLVTCRPAETGLPGLKELPLEGLARPDSLHLLAAILDLKGISTDREGYEREAIEALLDALDDHPLSIELVAPHLKSLPPARIQAEFGQLLERFSDERAYEGRNRSLLASLEFSKRRLSPEAQALLPTLAWFEGGVFEQFLLDFANLQPEAWQPLRDELVATALIRVEEEGIQINNRPYLHFHPTLPYAAAGQTPTQTAGVSETPAVSSLEAAAARFIEVYRAVRKVADDALQGRQPAAGMALLAREEANLRAAITSAFRRGERQAAWQMADTLGNYLERAGRLRERDSLVEWVRDNLPTDTGLDTAACHALLDHAWSLFTQGHAKEALEQVQGLIARLESEGLAGGADPTSQLAVSYFYQGKIYVESGRSDLALAPFQKTAILSEQLNDQANLSTIMGGLANAYVDLGRFAEALAAAEQGLAINRDLGRDREVAASLGQIAQILMEQQRYAEAEARYEEAVQAARATGDLGLQAGFLQNQGILQRKQENNNRAIELYKQALRLFQQANALDGEMQTCDLLASSEMLQGQLDAAEAWYARSRELALHLGDRKQQAIVAQNLGILYQNRAEQAPDPATRTALLRQAVASVEESLAIKLELKGQVLAASSYHQLGILYRLLGELDRAEEHALQALRIYESLNLPEVYRTYGVLANIARARGDEAAAARWQAKYEAKVEELERLRRGGGAEAQGGRGAGGQLAELILALAQAAYQARVSGAALEPQAAEALAQVAELPPPLGAVGAFLQAVAAGQQPPAVPAGLPPEVAQILAALVEALE
jgi:tetratricopeptide (TPR) repeat protein